MILRVHQIPPSALDELVEAGLLIAFDGVYVIAHWGLQNSVKNDRYKPTQYIEEFSSLENIEGVYKLKKQPSTCNGSNMEPTGNQTGTLTELNLTEHNKTNTGKGSARGNLKSHKDNSPSSASLQKIGKEEKRCFACGGNLIHTKDGAVYCFDCQMTYETAESAKRER
ncbi:MAG: hypothetical protein LBK67_02955 [Coriobacteriales bacterium]|nr:hypothetical protein [Coriobacteriales bacterium]